MGYILHGKHARVRGGSIFVAEGNTRLPHFCHDNGDHSTGVLVPHFACRLYE